MSAADRTTLLEHHHAVAGDILRHAPGVLLSYEYHGVYNLPATHPLRPWLAHATPVLWPTWHNPL